MKVEPLKNKEKDSMRELIRKGFHTRDIKLAVEYLKRYVRFDVFSQIDTPENYDKLMAKIDDAFEDVTKKKKKR